ncbi:hypothetical protein GCM10011521_27360 [Arenimonas soli]|uniref:Transmembrane protein n=1 Tax=Arenimonas soli TaxID=2269504 RepID=A0ABQ1HRS6_9GAMM|nr:DUF6776 family protein [Arenimonas soli]GGA87488.1 hypothetical protein GCM10011521_27360 [Arenimonas soli]
MNTPAPDKHRFVIVPHRPYVRVLLAIGLALWVASLVAVWMLASERAAPGRDQLRQELKLTSERAARSEDVARQLRQNVATLRRSDQISRAANTELQATLAEREEEVSALRADVAFYERLVGATGQRRGLSVHDAVFARESGGTWRYTVTLTQNLNRGAISKGEARMSVEGVSEGRLVNLGWAELLQKPDATGQPFSFRYFQQLEGSVMLPEGFTPQRVRVQLRSGGSTVEQAFPWEARAPRGD